MHTVGRYCLHHENPPMSDPGPCAVEMGGGGGGGFGCVVSASLFSCFFFPTSLRSGGLEHLDRYPSIQKEGEEGWWWERSQTRQSGPGVIIVVQNLRS